MRTRVGNDYSRSMAVVAAVLCRRRRKFLRAFAFSIVIVHVD